MMFMAMPRFRKRSPFAPGINAFLSLLFFAFCLISGPGECADLFCAQNLVAEDTPLSVLAADLDGAGPCEIIVVSRSGVYPRQKRWLSIFAASQGNQYAPAPHQRWEIDSRACMFAVGDVDPSPGSEIFFLTPDGIRYHARKADGLFATDARLLVSMPNAALFPSDTLLPRMTLLAAWQGPDRNSLLVPQLATAVLFSRNDTGTWEETQSLDMPPLARLYSDREDDGISRTYALRMDYRLPLPISEDFDGDGRTDLLFTEHESILVYLQQPGGHFVRHPAGRMVLPVRPDPPDSDTNLSILTTPVELNGDGFADAMVILSRGTGKFMERLIELHFFFNRKTPGAPFPPVPDQVIALRGITPGATLKDIDGDGRKDLLVSHIQLGFWNTVRSLVAKQTSVETAAFLLNAADRYPAKPDFQTDSTYKLDLGGGVSFHGVWPTLEGDFTGDGHADLLVARDGSVTVYPADEGDPLFASPHSQSDLPTAPFRQVVDLNRDGRDDLLFYEKKNKGRISVLVNTGDWTAKKASSRGAQPTAR